MENEQINNNMAKINYNMVLFNSQDEVIDFFNCTRYEGGNARLVYELNAKQKLVFLNMPFDGVTCEVFENGNKTVIKL